MEHESQKAPGILFGKNMLTETDIYLNLFDQECFCNANMMVYSSRGNGKYTFLNSMMSRIIKNNQKYISIDYDVEHKKTTLALGGQHVQLGHGNMMNMFDIRPIDGRYNVKQKASDIINIIGMMVGCLDNYDKSVIASTILKTYRDFKIIEEAEENDSKTMPQFSDFYANLEEFYKDNECEKTRRLLASLAIFKSDAAYDIFDCQTPEHMHSLADSAAVNICVSSLLGDLIQPLAVAISMSWIWDHLFDRAKYGAPNKKRYFILDMMELLISSEYSAALLENKARRMRCHNGGFIMITQNILEVENEVSFKAIAMNASVFMIFNQNQEEIELLSKYYKLTDYEKDALKSFKAGEYLLKAYNSSEQLRFVKMIVTDDEKKEMGLIKYLK